MHVLPLLPDDRQNQEEMGSAWTLEADVVVVSFFGGGGGGGKKERFMILCYDQHFISCSIQLVSRGIIYVCYTAERAEMLSILERTSEMV